MSNDTTLRQIQSGRTVPLAIEFHLIRYNTIRYSPLVLIDHLTFMNTIYSCTGTGIWNSVMRP
jgi:hypothetical protein